MKRLRDVLVLPAEMSEFEARHLARMNRIALYFFYGHLPVFVLLAFLNHTQPLLVGLLTAGGEQQDAHVLELGVAANLATDLEAVDHREHDVEND